MSRKRFSLLMVVPVVLALAALVGTGGLSAALAQGFGTFAGHLSGTGETLGGWTAQPAMCQTGHQSPRPDVAVRFIFAQPRTPRNPRGGPAFVDVIESAGNPPALEVTMSMAPNAPLHFDDKVCKSLHIDLAQPGESDPRQSLAGAIDADCALGGEQLFGHLEFKNCRF